MNIWLVSHLQDSPGNRLLMEAAEARGVPMLLVHPQTLSFPLSHDPRTFDLWSPQGSLPLPTAALVRMGGSAPEGAFDIVHWLAEREVPCINSPEAVRLCRDKAATYRALSRWGVPFPRTVLLGHHGPLERPLDVLGPPPWVLKSPVSTKGLGVEEIGSLAELRRRVEALGPEAQPWLVQELIHESRGEDIRVFVLEGAVRAAIRRTAQGDELRSNLHLGARGEAVTLDDHLAAIALSAARAVGARMAGVDLLLSNRGPLVCEVNGSPGLEGIQQATGSDLAGEIVNLAAALGPR